MNWYNNFLTPHNFSISLVVAKGFKVKRFKSSIKVLVLIENFSKDKTKVRIEFIDKSKISLGL